jgi:diketogulonate reductase-like aldo/keto reductase
LADSKTKLLFDGRPIPALGLGTWRMGGEESSDYRQDKELVRVLRNAIELGYTHLDTAEFYGKGHTEELVRQAVSDFERESLFITTKVWYTHLRYPALLQALEASLQRLGMDYVDLYLIHWPNPNVPIEETMRGMNEAVRKGLTRYIGVSNFDVSQIQQAAALAEVPLAANQVPYSLGERQYVRNGMLQYCQDNNVLLTAYSPLDVGKAANNPELRQVAEKYGATAAQVALAWLIQQEKVIAIPKAARLNHLEENLGALDLQLSAEDMQMLKDLRAS